MTPGHSRTSGAEEPYWPVLTAYALSVAMIAVSAFFLDQRVWGFYWYGFFGEKGIMLALLLAVLGPLAALRLPAGFRRKQDPYLDSPRTYLLWILIISSILLSLFVIFSSRTHFLGDGFQLLVRLAEGTSPIRPWNPGIYWIQNLLYGVLGGDGRAAALLTFQLISYISGVLFLLVSAWSAWRIFETNADRLLFFLGLVSGGYMLVFFGYVENYPLFLLCVISFTLLGVLAARQKCSRWLVLLPIAVALPLHPFSVALFAPAVFVLSQGTAFGGWVNSRPLWLKLVAVTVFVLISVVVFEYFYRTNYFFRFAIVPFVQYRFTIEGYSMFSAKHLVDYMNLLWQLLPGLLVGAVLAIRARSLIKSPEYLFLSLFIAGSLGIAFLFDPKLGMPRDWDMFCFAGVPLTVAVLLAALDVRVRAASTVRGAILMTALGFIILAPRVTVQAIPDAGVAMFDRYSDLDVFKNVGGRFLLLKYLDEKGMVQEATRRRYANTKTARFEKWDADAQALMRKGDYLAATKLYHQALDVYPVYHNAWTNLGVCYFQRGQYDSSIACLRIADGLNPFSVNVFHYLALSLYASGHDREAERYWLKARELVPGDYRPYEYLILMYEYSGRSENCRTIEDEVINRAVVPGADVRFVLKTCEIYLKRGDLPAAERECSRALSLGADTARVCGIQRRFPQLKVVECGP